MSSMFLARENYKFISFKKGERRLNNIIYCYNDLNGTTCISIISTTASKHKTCATLLFDESPSQLSLDKLTNALKMTTWTFSKNSIKNSEKFTLKDYLNSKNIAINFKTMITPTSTTLKNILKEDKLACLLKIYNSFSF